MIIEDKQGVTIDENFTSSTCSNSAVVKLKIKSGDNGEGGADGNGTMADKVRSIELSQMGKRGFYYRIPGRAVVTLVMAGRHETEMSRDTLSIAHSDQQFPYPPLRVDAVPSTHSNFFDPPVVYGISSWAPTRSSTRSNITDITDSASTILETLGERKESRRKANEPPDELSELECRRKILEEKKKIKELGADLGVIP